jgi:isovaleryl-CoA dehydrogenase
MPDNPHTQPLRPWVMTAGFDIANPTEEHRMLRDMVRNFVLEEVEPQALEHDRLERFNSDLFRKLGALGLHGITIDEAYGGVGMDATAVAIVNEELSYSDPGFCLAYLAHAQLMVNNLAFNGSEGQKARILPFVCSGQWIGCMGMSEPGYGTDVLGMSTSAIRQGDGSWLLNGRKMWITNGVIDDGDTPADVCMVYAKTGEDANGRSQITTFIVERGMEGYSVGQKIVDKLGMRASNTAELVFDDVRVPVENVVGLPGDSMIHMMRNLEIERIALAAMAVGISRRCLSIMNRYASDREAFGRRIREFGQIQRHIAESWAEYRAMRAYVYDTALRTRLSESGNRLDSDGVKLYSTTAAKNIADRAIQVLGGYGYVGEYVVERLWRDSKLLEIGGGTLESHQKNIARDLGRDSSPING